MSRKRDTLGQIIGYLREAEARLSQGETVYTICRTLGAFRTPMSGALGRVAQAVSPALVSSLMTRVTHVTRVSYINSLTRARESVYAE